METCLRLLEMSFSMKLKVLLYNCNILRFYTCHRQHCIINWCKLDTLCRLLSPAKELENRILYHTICVLKTTFSRVRQSTLKYANILQRLFKPHREWGPCQSISSSGNNSNIVCYDSEVVLKMLTVIICHAFICNWAIWKSTFVMRIEEMTLGPLCVKRSHRFDPPKDAVWRPILRVLLSLMEKKRDFSSTKCGETFKSRLVLAWWQLCDFINRALGRFSYTDFDDSTRVADFRRCDIWVLICWKNTTG